MKTLRLIALVLVSLMLVSCNGESGSPPAETTNSSAAAPAATFDRRAMLQNITNQLILPKHEAFLAAIKDLEAAAQAFTQDPTPVTLAAVQDTVLAANTAWMAVVPFNVGLAKDSLLQNRFDTRPARTGFIDNDILTGDMDITPEYLNYIGSSSVGLGVLEYLLFDPAGGNEVVLRSFTDAENATRRRALLLAEAQTMTMKAEELLSLWSADGQNYAQAFIDADTDGGDLQGSMNMLANLMIYEVEDVIDSRLGKPLGKRTNGAIRPDLVEAPYSGESLPRIIATLEGVQAVFNGGDGLGFDDYLDFLGASYGEQPLSVAINAQFDASLAALRAIDEPLETAVETDFDQVDAAYEELRALLPLLKADMVNHLGLTLTFSTNDGD